MKTYSEKLKDPRWQRKRLEIMERDDFSCRSCFSREKPLQVHHCYYLPKQNPWDYNSDSLITLCEECHYEQTHRIPHLMMQNRTPCETMINTHLLSLAGSSKENQGIVMEVAYGLSLLNDGEKEHGFHVLSYAIELLKELASEIYLKPTLEQLIDDAPESPDQELK